MDPPPRGSAAAAGSGSSAAYTAEIAESLRFEEEIQSLMRDNTLIHPSLDPAPPPPPPPPPPPSSSSAASSFTALLGLSPNQAVELLHDSIGAAAAAASPAAAAAADPWPRLGLPLPRASPTFPSNAALVDRAARFSVFAAAAAASAADSDSSSPASSSGDPSPRPNHPDPPAAPPPPPPPLPRRPSPAPKRKDPPSSSPADKSKAKAKAKTKRSSGGGSRTAEDDTGSLQKLPYVHVRARRGQATDSHSLAERARREKINARMKLLQELVPGCSKISGTALVLDEIISHVQSLQRQVEFLSMRLAAVNPRVDFGGLDSFLSAECGRITGDNGNGNGNGNGKNGAEEEGPRATWTDGGSDGVRRPHHHHQQQIWHVDLAHPHPAPSVWERGPGDANAPHLFINPSSGVASLYGYDPSSASAAPLQSNQLKTEL